MMDAAEGQPAIAPDLESSPLMYLPSEMWGKILKKIGQEDARNLRLVNKDFMEKVNNLYEDWKIILDGLDENMPFLEMILNLRVKEVDVYRFHQTASFRPPGILFKYPDLIQKLALSTTMWSTQNTHMLLQSKNLKFISLRLLRGNIEPFEALGPLEYHYPDLHTLEIHLETSKKDEAQLLEPGNLFQRMMTSSTMPKLNSFNFSYNFHNNNDTIYNYSSVLLSFLSRQGQNLQHFYCTSWILQIHPYTVFPPLDDSIVPNNMTSLKTLQIHCKGDVDPLHQTWRSLLQNQKNLVDLDLGYRFDISSTFLSKIVAKNFQTLTSVEIKSWTFEERQRDGVLDASIFQGCHSLTRLIVIPAKKSSKVVNLFSLPTPIQTLYLSDFGAHSGDFLKFLLGHSVLSELGIYFSGNLPVLEAILTHSGLLYVHIVGGIDEPASLTEIARLNEIFDTLGFTKFKGQFDFEVNIEIERASVFENWKACHQNYG